MAISLTDRELANTLAALRYWQLDLGREYAHLRRMREIYAERLSVLLEYGRQKLSGLLDISSVEAGLETVGWLPPDIDAVSAAKAASTHDVEVIPLSAYSRRPSSREGLQLGFAAVDATELRRGVRELERTLRRMV